MSHIYLMLTVDWSPDGILAAYFTFRVICSLIFIESPAVKWDQPYLVLLKYSVTKPPTSNTAELMMDIYLLL